MSFTCIATFLKDCEDIQINSPFSLDVFFEDYDNLVLAKSDFFSIEPDLEKLFKNFKIFECMSTFRFYSNYKDIRCYLNCKNFKELKQAIYNRAAEIFVSLCEHFGKFMGSTVILFDIKTTIPTYLAGLFGLIKKYFSNESRKFTEIKEIFEAVENLRSSNWTNEVINGNLRNVQGCYSPPEIIIEALSNFNISLYKKSNDDFVKFVMKVYYFSSLKSNLKDIRINIEFVRLLKTYSAEHKEILLKQIEKIEVQDAKNKFISNLIGFLNAKIGNNSSIVSIDKKNSVSFFKKELSSKALSVKELVSFYINLPAINEYPELKNTLTDISTPLPSVEEMDEIEKSLHDGRDPVAASTTI